MAHPHPPFGHLLPSSEKGHNAAPLKGEGTVCGGFSLFGGVYNGGVEITY